MAESGAGRVQEQFGRQAAYYSVSQVHATGDTLSLLVDWGHTEPGFSVLDVATGTGFTAFAFSPHVARVVAYDLTREMLTEATRLARERGLRNVGYVQGMAEKLPFPDASFDVVSCRTAPHHFESIETFVQEAARVVKPGGRVVIADTSAPDDPELFRWMNHIEKLRDPSHVENRTPQQWQSIFTDTGLVVEAVDTVNRTDLTFFDWVERSGTPPDVAEECHRLFKTASPEVRASFEIAPLDKNDFAFSWMVTSIAGRRP